MIIRVPVSYQLEDILSDVIKIFRRYEKTRAKESLLYFKFVDSWYWDNKNLYPEYKWIPKGSKIYRYLVYAKEHGTLEMIQEDIEPHAAVAKAKKWGPICNHWVTFNIWDLTGIRFLAEKKNVIISQNFKEYEIWSFFCNRKHVKRFVDFVFDEIKKWYRNIW